ncbi:SURF1 family protein [Nocardioides sp. zg-1228]|uniref:SURF1 family protein n=1 Tax=Nocardioides sp. zg-1228 TaxID=2763008 RepID=UPI001642E738|nr:SURF1 family protein [Nocardioides sp. zg-1228]MBC2932159.1 SURF1 family protein [Nocardioides sp. zg-1228]QSF57697.1 SURF1 family protein [Nocardioides sp. zg-1228]
MTAPRRPSLLIDVAAAALALVLVGIAGMLGKWQYDAFEADRAAEARDLTDVAPVPLTDVMGNDDPFRASDLGRPVEVSGRWLDGGFWVADREGSGEPGYWAVAPLQTGDAAVLVVRGWAPEPDPDLLAVSGEAEVTGWLQAPEATIVTDDDPDDDVFPEIRVADAVQRVDVDLWSAFIISDEPGPGLEEAELESLPSPSRSTGIRNLLYAAEWWVFGAFAAYIWWRWRRDATAPEMRSPSAG